MKHGFSCALCVALVAFLAGCATSPFVRKAASRVPRSEVECAIREACEKGDWAKAQQLCRERFATQKNALAQIDSGTSLAIACWNGGERFAAVIAMDAVVAASVSFGPDCERLAQIFRNAFRSGAVPEKFTVEEATGRVGLRRALLDAAESPAGGVKQKL